MRLKSIVDQHRSGSENEHQGKSATQVPRRSLDALWKRLEVAESAVRSLEKENEQLRAERARAILAAARATEAFEASRQSQPTEFVPRFEAITKELKIAEAARAEAARERKAAIEAVSNALKAECSDQIAVLQQQHADELAMLWTLADRQARDAVARELDESASEVSEAKHALVTAKRERERDLRALEERLGKEYDEKIDALHRHYATVLEDLSKQEKEHFATELASSLSNAHAAWREDTAKQVRRATETAAKAINGERARWQRRQRRALRRAAFMWRRREHRRLRAAREQLKSAQRRAIDACNTRWRSKFDRYRREARLLAMCSAATARVWELVKSFGVCLTSQQAVATSDKDVRPHPTRPTRMEACITAAAMIFLGVNFSLTAGFPAASEKSTSAAAGKKSSQIASVPGGKSGAIQSAEPMLPRQASPRGSNSGKSIASPHPTFGRPTTPPKAHTGKSAVATKPSAQQPIRNTIVRPDKRIEEQKIRERLRENIRSLRTERTAN